MTPDSFTIVLDPEGGMTYLHAEALNFPGMGAKQVTRASDVEFDHVAQQWIATLMDGREIARDVSRDAVLRTERSVIDGMLARGEPIPTLPVNHAVHG